MLNKTLLLFILLFMSGCVERGFDLTVNQTTHTVTAIKTVDTRTVRGNIQTDIKKMNTAVKKEQKELISTRKTRRADIKKSRANYKKEVYKAKEAQKERDALLKKQAREKEKQLALAEKERQALKNKAKEAKIAQEKKAEKIKAIQVHRKKDILEKKFVLEKQLQQKKERENKLSLEQKIVLEKKRQLKKAQEEQAALEKKIYDQKIADQKKSALTLQTKEDATKRALPITEPLIFQRSKQIYQEFGTSEIHGHVVYLTPSGEEIQLKQTKIYLVSPNEKIDYWYNNYYLKNKESSSVSKTTVNYINATHLNLEKNFAFYGLATGTYYIIIESFYPSSIAKNKKIYIAKKINVEKYKKIMTVFSKKL